MSRRKRHEKERANYTVNRFESPTIGHAPNKSKKSLGILRPSTKTKPRSPDATGKLCLQRHTFLEIGRLLDENRGDEVICNIAGWRNHDQQGEYLTVEISPRFAPRHYNKSRPGFLGFIGDDQDE
jgi:hypothetical protein